MEESSGFVEVVEFEEIKIKLSLGYEAEVIKIWPCSLTIATCVLALQKQ